MRRRAERQHRERAKMQRARRLMPTEEIEQHRGRGGHGRRHRQASQDKKRRHDEDDERVAGTLQWSVVGAARRRRHHAAQVLPQIATERRERERLAPADEVTMEVSRDDAGQHVDQAHSHEHPRGQEMQAASPPVLVEDLERAPGRNRGARASQERRWYSPAAMPVVAADRQLQEWRRQVVACLAPIETWMHHQDLDAAEDQRRHTDGGHPVREPHPPRVPGHLTFAPALRTTTHVPLRFSMRSIHTYSPPTSFPARVLFSVTLPCTTATLPFTCTSIGPSSNASSRSTADLKSRNTFSFVTTAPEAPMLVQSSAKIRLSFSMSTATMACPMSRSICLSDSTTAGSFHRV